ncbi:hypothetical protein TNCV_5085201 [Trichonephila clavipes]|uniref:Uncharacterized protein n=1 Tax=Trichonephila clavipes TaxID=2585209 RepID=A0A8X6S5Q7_TRICX|nr:hypothetical protein TNCV_5085201 [Trichonephila clavipes]
MRLSQTVTQVKSLLNLFSEKRETTYFFSYLYSSVANINTTHAQLPRTEKLLSTPPSLHEKSHSEIPFRFPGTCHWVDPPQWMYNWGSLRIRFKRDTIWNKS